MFLFLLALLAMIGATHILDNIWKWITGKYKDEEETTKITIRRKRKKKLKQDPATKNKVVHKKIFTLAELANVSKKVSLHQIVHAYNTLSEKQLDQIRRALIKNAGHKNWKLRRYYEEFLTKLRFAIDQHNKGRELTDNQKKLVDLAKKLLINPKGENKYVMGRSSWILALKYTADSKRLWVKMARGKVIYKFLNVGEMDYIALITCDGTMGIYWWRNWYWRFSTNASRWEKFRRRK